MTKGDSGVGLRHPSFCPRTATPLAQAHLTDRQKLAVVLQAAAVASLLDASSQKLVGKWVELCVDRKGLVCGLESTRDRSSSSHQTWLCELLDVLFQADGEIAGRGQVRSIARRLQRSWYGFPTPLQADRAVSNILDLAPFLWTTSFATVRSLLAGEIRTLGRATLWLAGRGRFRSLALRQVESLAQLRELLEGPRARELWTSASDEDWRRAVALDSAKGAEVPCKPPLLPNLTGPVAKLMARRRELTKEQAAETWSEVVRSRLEQGDLSGADRAATHAMILQPISGDAPYCFRLLAELILVRIRRGRFKGLPRALDQLDYWSRSGGVVDRNPNVSLLRARFELGRGMPATTLENIARYQDLCERSRLEPARVSRVLEARALGWLGRAAECRSIVQELDRSDWLQLEPEEEPALWALSGDPDRAYELAKGSRWEGIWKAVSDRSTAAPEIWDSLSCLEDYRVARLVLDIELMRRDLVPDRWIRYAESCFRKVGAGAFAARLDRNRKGSWRVLANYFGSSPSSGDRAVQRLFEDAGYFDARLSWSGCSELRVLVPGAGGSEELSEELARGELLLQAEIVDPPLRALFALAVREYLPASTASHRHHRIRGLVGDSEALNSALVRLEKLAAQEITVLIRGETGTGKEIAARQLHRLSRRSKGLFVAVNCAALSESLLLSELFGHARGAFTGADRSRAGIFETASGGTVFLDEIGDLPLQAQGKLLRVLQEGEVRRLGESTPRSVDVRVVAATHCDLDSMIEKGEFRRDLYYRLCVSSVVLPPLRDRGNDVLLLAEHFLQQGGYSMTAEAGQRLLRHGWPGNVRELKNVIELATALCDGKLVGAENFEMPAEQTQSKVGYHRQVEDFRRSLVREALLASGGRRAEAARRLNLSRQALSYLAKTLRVE